MAGRRGNPKVVNYIELAVQEGLDSLMHEHPRFAQYQDYVLKHIDQGKIREKIQNIREKVKDENLSETELAYRIQKGLSSYVASGKVLDDIGKETLIGNSLEEKVSGEQSGGWGKVRNFFSSKPKFNGEKYLDKAFGAFDDLYTLMKSGDYAKRMPELAESLGTLYDLKFLDPAISVLKSRGMINKDKYNFLKENVYKKTREESDKVVGHIERYFTPQKMAASVFLLLGFAILVFNLRLTGAAIGLAGFSGSFVWSIVGFFMLVLSATLFLISSGKKPKI